MIPKGWDVKPLGELVTIRSGGTPSKSRPDYWGGSVNWFTAKDLKSLTLRESEIKLSELGAQSSIVVEPGTILVLTRGMGLLNDVPMGICEQRSAFNQDVKALLAHAGVHARFLLYALVNTKHRISNLITTAGHGTCRLETESLLEHSLFIPEPSEQAAIAGVLSSCDAVEERVEALLTAKQRRRQALSQRLLTGKARLPGFVEQPGAMPTKPYPLPKDWAYPPIGEVCQEYSARNNRAKDLPVLSCTVRQGLVSSLEYFGKRVFSEETSAYKLVPRGTFAYATNHIEEGSIGYQELYDLALISPIYTVFKTSPGVDDAFLYCLLKTEWYRQLFQKHTNSSVDRRGSLRWSHFSEIPIPLPSLKEQQAIMEVIQDADREIALHRAELDALKRQKRGLMQQLLTGKVRVP